MNSYKVVYYPVDENGHFFNFILRKRPPSPDSQLLKYEDSKISVFKPWRFLNLHVLKHGDSKISMFWNTATKFCIKKFKIPILKLL